MISMFGQPRMILTRQSELRSGFSLGNLTEIYKENSLQFCKQILQMLENLNLRGRKYVKEIGLNQNASERF